MAKSITHNVTVDVNNMLKAEGAQLTSIPKALIEFSENAMQYRTTPNVDALVQITLDIKGGKLREVKVADNGYGMNEKDFKRFFHVHSDNEERLAGRPGRGRFGLGGKQAIIGLKVKRAHIESVKDGVLHVVEWSHSHLDKWKYTNHGATTRSTGTTISLFGIGRTANIDQITKALLREHRTHLNNNWLVVNGERITYTPPVFDREETFNPPVELAGLIGNPTLTLRVTSEALPQEERGVQILANGVPHEDNFLGEFTTRPQAARVYGFIDVPILETEDNEGVPAYTSERSQQLKRDNQRVAALLPWMNTCLATFVRSIEEEHQKVLDAKNVEELERQANALSSVLTEAWRGLDMAPRRNSTDGVKAPDLGIELSEDVTSGDEIPIYRFSKDGEVNVVENPDGDVLVMAERGESRPHPPHPPNPNPNPEPTATHGVVIEEGVGTATLAKKIAKKNQSSARIEVKWDHLGSSSDRASWDANQYTLTVNLDVPELVGMELTSNLFQEKVKQIAIATFSIALVETKSIKGDPDIDPSDLFSVTAAVRNAQNILGKAFHAAKVRLETEISESQPDEPTK